MQTHSVWNQHWNTVAAPTVPCVHNAMLMAGAAAGAIRSEMRETHSREWAGSKSTVSTSTSTRELRQRRKEEKLLLIVLLKLAASLAAHERGGWGASDVRLNWIAVNKQNKQKKIENGSSSSSSSSCWQTVAKLQLSTISVCKGESEKRKESTRISNKTLVFRVCVCVQCTPNDERSLADWIVNLSRSRSLSNFQFTRNANKMQTKANTSEN